MKSLGGYLSAHKKRMAVGLTIKSFGTVAELFLPMIMAYMIDDVAPTGSVLQLSLWGVAMLAFAVIAWGGNVIANRMASRVARDTTEVIRNDLFTSTLYLSARQTDKVTVPSLVSRLSSDTYNVHNMIGMIQRLGVRVPILLIGGVALTFSVEPVLALVLLAVVPFLTAVVIFVSSKGITLYTDLQRAVDTMVRKVRDDYTGIRVIKALSRTEYEKQGFAKINENVVGFMYLTKRIMDFTSVFFIAAFAVVYQSDLKAFFNKIARTRDKSQEYEFNSTDDELVNAAEQIVKACQNMAKNDVGALIIIVRTSISSHILETGTELNAEISSGLLESIFSTKGPLHDGAVIVKGSRLLSAGCFLPLSQEVDIAKELGTRHRAAIGVTEESDVFAIVVSEETGIISTVEKGKIRRYMTPEKLFEQIKVAYGITQDTSGREKKRENRFL